MSKEESKCFDFNSKQKHYENWKRFIENLSSDKQKEKESKNKKKEKKTFEDYFPISRITKSVNRLDYEPLWGHK